MPENKVRLATTVDPQVDAKLRELSAQQKVPNSVVVTTLLSYALNRLNHEDGEVRANLNAAAQKHREMRAEIGRYSMDSRYGKLDADTPPSRSRAKDGDDTAPSPWDSPEAEGSTEDPDDTPDIRSRFGVDELKKSFRGGWTAKVDLSEADAADLERAAQKAARTTTYGKEQN